MSNCILYNLHLLLLQEYYGFFTPLLEIPIPTIAALNGPAIGAGFCVSMFCDLRITADDAKLGLYSKHHFFEFCLAIIFVAADVQIHPIPAKFQAATPCTVPQS